MTFISSLLFLFAINVNLFQNIGITGTNKIDMRPIILNSLFARISTIKGVGDKAVPFFRNLLSPKNYESTDVEEVEKSEPVPKVIDLLYHLPSGIIDRTKTIRLSETKSGDLVTTVVRVEEHQPSSKFIKPCVF